MESQELLTKTPEELEQIYKENPLWYYQNYVALSASPKYDGLTAVLGLVEEAGEVAGIVRKSNTYDDPSKFIAKYGKTVQDGVLDELSDTLFQLVNVAHRYGLTLQQIMDYNLKKLDTRMSPTGEWYFAAGLGLTKPDGGTYKR